MKPTSKTDLRDPDDRRARGSTAAESAFDAHAPAGDDAYVWEMGPEAAGEEAPVAPPWTRGEQRRRPAAGRNLLLWLVVSGFCLALLATIRGVYTEYRWLSEQAAEKQSRLAALEKQYAAGRRRLAVLESSKYSEQLLLEHGYIRPGDRILLFPPSPGKKADATRSPNDLAPPDRPAPADRKPEPGWERSLGSLERFLNELRGLQRQPVPATRHSRRLGISQDTSRC